ncbi:MAG: histidinol-phosphate transaminase [bacterium]
MDFRQLVRPAIRPLKPYTNTRSTYNGEIFLDDMESPFWGRYELKLDNIPLNRYPDGMFTALREKVARFVGYGMTGKNIVLGNGSDELISLLMLIFLEAGDNIVVSPPTFTMYDLLATMHKAEVHSVSLESETFALNAEKVLQQVDAKTKIIFLCNPNNPTGTLLDRAEIEKVVNNAPCLVVVDEAYGEYFPDTFSSFIQEISTRENLIVFRTFSKAWGLAGIRCGYAVAPEWAITEFDKVRLPFNIDRMTATIIDQVLDQERVMRATVHELVAERQWMEQQLQDLGLKTFPTITNFLCAKLPEQHSATEITATLAKEHGILIRDRSKEKHLGNSIRVSVEDTRAKNERFIAAMKTLMEK